MLASTNHAFKNVVQRASHASIPSVSTHPRFPRSIVKLKRELALSWLYYSRSTRKGHFLYYKQRHWSSLRGSGGAGDHGWTAPQEVRMCILYFPDSPKATMAHSYAYILLSASFVFCCFFSPSRP